MAEGTDCFICDKHQTWPQVLRIHADDLGVVTHAAGDVIYHGFLFVEPRRHVPGWEDLTTTEAAHLGQLMQRSARALRNLGCEHVYSFVYGDSVPHLHIYLVGRWPGAPKEFWAVETTKWPEAPRSPLSEIAAFTERLRSEMSRPS